jgi:ABC-2 type transport system permease protein
MKMILAVMYREFRIRTTSMIWIFYDLLIPLLYLLIFGIALNRTIGTGISLAGTTVSYNAFFLAGVLSMASFGIALNTAYGFFVDRDNGIFYELLTYPMTRPQFLMGKILFNCLLAILQAAITILFGALLLDIPLLWGRMGILLLAVILATAGWFFFLTSFALRIRRNDMFNTFINLAYFVLMFASSIFYPLEGMPGWLRVTALLNPLTWHTDVLRFATVGAESPVLLESLAFVGFLLGSFYFALRTLRYAILK